MRQPPRCLTFLAFVRAGAPRRLPACLLLVWLRWRQRRVDLLRREKKGVSACWESGYCELPYYAVAPLPHTIRNQNVQLRWVPNRAKRSCSFPATSAKPATLHASTTVFSVYFHSPCGCFDAFIALGGSCRLSPFNLMLKLTANATLARKLALRTGVLDDNKCLPDCSARCWSLH